MILLGWVKNWVGSMGFLGDFRLYVVFLDMMMFMVILYMVYNFCNGIVLVSY